MKPYFKFNKFGPIFLVGMLIFALFGYAKNVYTNPSQLEGYPIVFDVFTTLESTIVTVPVPSNSPALLLTDISKYSQYAYGVSQFGSGLGYEKRLDPMEDAYNPTSASDVARLLNFFTTQTLDAVVQTVDALHKEKPFDFGNALVDTANSSQYNELKG